MKVKWIVVRKGGSVETMTTDEDTLPNLGDGKVVNDIGTVVSSRIDNPISGKLTGDFDVIVIAEER